MLQKDRRAVEIVLGILSAAFVLAGAIGNRLLQGQSATPEARQQETGQAQSQSAASFVATERLHAETRLVRVSVIVKDKQGNPISDLTSADFVIRDEKQVQKIRFFRIDTNDPPAKAPQTMPPDTYTNRPQDFGGVPPSVTMILLDGLNTEYADQASARAQVVKFLKQIQPQDHVALYALGRDLRVIHDFTTDSSRLVEALAKSTAPMTGDLDASTPQEVQTGNDDIDSLLQNAFQLEANFYIQDRVHLTVEALTAIAEHVSPLPGRKNLIWVSGSFPFSVGYENVDDLLNNINNPSYEQLLFADDVEKAARALNDADIAVYPVDARGLLGLNLGTNKTSNRLPAQGPMGSGITTRSGNTGGLPGSGGQPSSGGGRGGGNKRRSRPPTPSAANTRPTSPIQSPDKTNFETMDTLADRTGGKAFYNSNDIFEAIHQAVDDSRLTYQLGYYPENVKWDGSFRSIDIEVKRPQVQVRARKGYFALPSPKLTPDSKRDALLLAATSPLDASEIAMVVKSSASDSPQPRTLSLTVRIDARAVQFLQNDGKWTATADTVFVQRDKDGKILSGMQDTLQMNYPDDTYKKVQQYGISFSKAIVVDPNAADLRVVLRDAATGRLGAVRIELAKYFPPAKPAN